MELGADMLHTQLPRTYRAASDTPLGRSIAGFDRAATEHHLVTGSEARMYAEWPFFLFLYVKNS